MMILLALTVIVGMNAQMLYLLFRKEPLPPESKPTVKEEMLEREVLQFRRDNAVYVERNRQLEEENEDLKRWARNQGALVLFEKPKRAEPLVTQLRRKTDSWKPVIPPLQTVYLGPRETPEG